MNEDSWLEAAYEDRNGGDVDTAGMGYPYESVFHDEEPEQPVSCSRDWMDSPCSGKLIFRTTSGGFPDAMCEHHLEALQDSLDAIAERYPEIGHPEYCTCYGCSDGSY